MGGYGGSVFGILLAITNCVPVLKTGQVVTLQVVKYRNHFGSLGCVLRDFRITGKWLLRIRSDLVLILMACSASAWVIKV